VTSEQPLRMVTAVETAAATPSVLRKFSTPPCCSGVLNLRRTFPSDDETSFARTVEIRIKRAKCPS